MITPWAGAHNCLGTIVLACPARHGHNMDHFFANPVKQVPNGPTTNPENALPPDSWRPVVLVLDDEWSILERIQGSLGQEYEVVTASRAQEAQELVASRAFDVVLTDLRMPDMDGLSLVRQLKERSPETQYIIMTAFGDIEDTISALRLGVADYLRKPFTMGEVRHALERCLEQRRLRREVATLRAAGPQTLSDIITRSPAMVELLRLAQTVAATDVSVLITGETGTGKELMAGPSTPPAPAAKRPFVDGQLRGHSARPSSRASSSATSAGPSPAPTPAGGPLRAAHGGTLFLDEVGEMLPGHAGQAARAFCRSSPSSGWAAPRPCASTCASWPPPTATSSRRWPRAASARTCFYRLNVIHLDLPSLSQRPEDIPLLAQFFLQRFALKYGKQVRGLSPQVQEQLLGHAWPGNVRELEHVMERAVILCRSPLVQSLDLDLGQAATAPAAPAWPPPPAPDQAVDCGLPLHDYLARGEKRYLTALLQTHQGSIQQTARAAGVNPKTLYLKMTRHGLSKRDFRPRPGQAPPAQPGPGPDGVS